LLVEFARKVWRKALVTWWSVTVPVRLRLSGYETDPNVRYYGCPEVTLARNSNIEIGARVVLCSDTRFTALGVSRPVILRTLREHAKIEIGKDTGISGAVICAAVGVTIGSECLLGADVMIFDTDFHPVNPHQRRYSQDPSRIAAAPVVIGDNVFIGARSIVAKGARIGANTVIGSGSVVVGEIPANCIAAGTPARVVRMLSETDESAR
jgi:acetyltransferase-like isoleucine patch superfamily enzyme